MSNKLRAFLPLIIMVGVASLYFGSDIDGFIGGMLQGGGLMLTLIGCALFGASLRKTQPGDDRTWWLPSKDKQ